MKLTRGLVVALAVGLVGLAGGTALAADNAPSAKAPATRSLPVRAVKGFAPAPTRLVHPASSPALVVVEATPAPMPTAKPKPKAKVAPKPTRSTAPAPARSTSPAPVAAKPKPKATPRPTPVSTPKPTPTPTSAVRTSGVLPPITIEYVVGTGPVQTWSGDSFNMTWTCPVLYADCQAVYFDIMPWGNDYLKVTYTDTVTWTVGSNVTSTITDAGGITGYGSKSGAYHLGLSDMVYKTHLVVTVAWA